jgi:hypothetical protein|tara:strand:- start:312 stop:1223 length:912 start_codon:yes stop_codon:yes gene_type:complete
MGESLTPADRLAIHDLLAAYNWAIDTRDPDGYAATFVANGTFDGGSEFLSTQDELRAFVGVMAKAPGAQGLQHWTTNLVIRETLEGAVVRSYMSGPKLADDGCIIGVVGTYEDVIVRDSGSWKFASRVWREVIPNTSPTPRITTAEPVANETRSRGSTRSTREDMMTTDVSVQDRLNILELLARYSWAFDTGDGPAYAQVFTEDGIMEGGTTRIEGREALEAFVKRLFNPAVPKQHWTTNHRFEPNEDGCRVYSYLMELEIDEEGNNHVAIVGCYEDDAVRSDLGWLLAHRVFKPWNVWLERA